MSKGIIAGLFAASIFSQLMGISSIPSDLAGLAIVFYWIGKEGI